MHVMIHDHLDGPFVRAKLFAESGMMFGPLTASINNIMNGAPISTMGSDLNVPLWLIYFFGPFNAYAVNQLAIRLIAYLGMYLLLRRHVLTGNFSQLTAFGSALIFAILPFYAMFGLTIAGQPLALYAFLNIRKHIADWKDWLIISAIPFYSLFVLSYIFVLPILSLLWVYDLLKHRTANIKFAGAIMLMAGLFVLVDYRLVISFLFPEYGFISHRTEMHLNQPSLIDALYQARANFLYGNEFAHSLHNQVVLPVILLAILFQTWSKTNLKPFVTFFATVALASLWYFWPLFSPLTGPTAQIIIASTVLISALLRKKLTSLGKLLAVIATISLFYGLWPLVWPTVKSALPMFPYFNMSRFHFLHPLLWYVAFGIALSMLWNHFPKAGKPFCILVMGLQIVFLFNQSDENTQKQLLKPTYAEFYSPALFQDIATFIGKDKPSYRICSLGIHPGIALYNGFFTLDGQLPNYPIDYKHKFRKLIANELEKNELFRRYFDEWGTRFYIFSSELAPLEGDAFMLTKAIVKTKKILINKFEFNTPEFKAMGGEYIFSAVKIQNSEEIGLHLEKIFDRNDSPWTIHLYSAH